MVTGFLTKIFGTKSQRDLKKLKPLVAPIFQAFDEQKGELIERYADRDEKGKLFQPGPNAFRFTKRVAEFMREYDKFMELESEIPFKRLSIVLKEDVPDKSGKPKEE